MASLGSLEAILQNPVQLMAGSREQAKEVVVSLRSLLVTMGLTVSLKPADRLIEILSSTADWKKTSRVQMLVNQLVVCVKDEAASVLAWQVPREKLVFFERAPFGPEVHAGFPSANDDIEEAGKCLGMGRNTAAVFHLMRIMETGLRSLGASLKDSTLDPRTNPNWEKILGKCDKAMQQPLRDRSQEWQPDEPFFSTATANLRAVKDAWRNPTMHVERRYNDEEAREVCNASRAFMRHLATKLSEEPGSRERPGG
jgi:hypothetical protein